MSVVAKPLIDLNRVWYEWIQDSKMLQKGKASLRQVALSDDRSYYFYCDFGKNRKGSPENQKIKKKNLDLKALLIAASPGHLLE